MTKKNKLISTDLDAWLKEIEKVQPLDRNKIASLEKSTPLKPKVRSIGNAFAQDRSRYLPENIPNLKLNDKSNIDAKTRRKMDRGEIEIDAVLDLHNQTLEMAFSSLVQFIDKSFRLSKRLLLVVTGKGKGSGDSLTTIKKEFLVWINDPMLRNKIIRFSQAHIKHGGAGAFYILLKRHK